MRASADLEVEVECWEREAPCLSLPLLLLFFFFLPPSRAKPPVRTEDLMLPPMEAMAFEIWVWFRVVLIAAAAAAATVTGRR